MRKLHHCKNGEYSGLSGLACSLSREQKCKNFIKLSKILLEKKSHKKNCRRGRPKPQPQTAERSSKFRLLRLSCFFFRGEQSYRVGVPVVARWSDCDSPSHQSINHSHQMHTGHRRRRRRPGRRWSMEEAKAAMEKALREGVEDVECRAL